MLWLDLRRITEHLGPDVTKIVLEKMVDFSKIVTSKHGQYFPFFAHNKTDKTNKQQQQQQNQDAWKDLTVKSLSSEKIMPKRSSRQ